jgi:cytochrome c553
LTADECRALASFILEAAEGEVSLEDDLAPGDAQRGERLFNSIGCANCHSVVAGRLPVGTKRWTIENLERGCLVRQDSRRVGTPRYALDDVSLAALAEFLCSDGQSLSRTVAEEFSQRQWKSMNCKACHGRDGHSALLPYVLLEDGVQGRAAEPVPDLTWAGEKLRPAWSRQLFAGRLGYRPRPHFRIRMPRLHARGDWISTGLSHEHGFDLEENPRPPHDEELAAIGSEVAASSTGLACHRCHAIGERQATAPLEVLSTNLWYVTERLRYGFYHRWLRDPLRIDPQTKMIKFAQDGRRTGLDTYYDGDARQQFEAVWHYLEQLNRDMREKE